MMLLIARREYLPTNLSGGYHFQLAAPSPPPHHRYNVGDNCDNTVVGGGSCGPERFGMGRFGDGQTTLGGLHIGGVFNGLSNYTVSHRARLPAIHNVYVAAPTPSPGPPSCNTTHQQTECTLTPGKPWHQPTKTACIQLGCCWRDHGVHSSGNKCINPKPPTDPADVVFVDQALDVRRGLFSNRSKVAGTVLFPLSANTP
jgi:hypothetical protein